MIYTDLDTQMTAYLKHQELWYCVWSYFSWLAQFIFFTEFTLWRISVWLSIGYIITESLNARAINTRIWIKVNNLKTAMETSIRVMHWWIQKASEKINESLVSRVKNRTKAIIPQIGRKLSVKRILTWKSLARKIKKKIIQLTFLANMNKSLKRKKMMKVMKRKKNRSKINRFNSK